MQIDDALADYDGFVIRNGQMLGFEPARVQAVSSLRNWIAGASCIARSEIAYLDHSHDLFSISSTDDTVICWLEALVEKLLIQLRRHLGLQHYFRRSNNPKVHVVPRASVTRLGRVLMTPFVVGLILAPVIVCNYLASLTARLITVVSAASLFIAVLSGSTKAKTIELVVAGATYTTVLIVFITSNNASAVQQSSH
ncbi:hypothetical protein PMIN04_002481 [Paraphaeosphaeria minitans]|uniref:DUF6594 domain-containing protein n=1 Tax=Paraphaeosphaeria minitans TaxID=565426 RepID=A0A9P6GMD1_9PLEO|nr:hypothetical protein PMIN01_04809 [Paraphaeosphaeria minitans]